MSTEDAAAMPRDMLAARVDDVEREWYRAEAELAQARRELAEARAVLGRIVSATRPRWGVPSGTGAAVAHQLASQALRGQQPDPPRPPQPQPDPGPYHPDRDPSPWQPRAVAA